MPRGRRVLTIVALRSLALVLSLLAVGCVPSGGSALRPDGGEPDGSDAAPIHEDASGPELPARDAGVADASPADLSLADLGPAPDGGPRELLSLSLAVTPSSVSEGESAALSVERVYDDGTREPLAEELEWFVATATVAELRLPELRGKAPGRTRVRARLGDLASNEAVFTVTPRGELRGVWVSRWQYSSANDLQAVVNDAVATNLNAIFLQVRGEADAFYDSSLEPWSRILSGTLGQNPGWDPLAELLTRAHAAGLQVHAWVNTFPAWQSATPPGNATPAHALNANPSWLCANQNGTPMAPGESSYQFFSPGNPAVRAHIAAVLEDLAEKYDIDGLHLDYVRYPGPTYCHDAASVAEYDRLRAIDPTLAWAAFQRENVARTVQAVRARLLDVRPNAVLTAATWGIYRNKWNWSSVSKGYDDYFQDAHGYIGRGLLDAIVPMTYWASTAVEGQRLDFAALTEDHVAAAAAAGRYAFAGISAEHDGTELLRQVQIARGKGARGVVFFEIGSLRSGGHLTRLRQGPFSQPAEVPPFAFR